MKPAYLETLERAIDLLVQQGRAERVIVDGKPGVKLIKKEDKS